MNVEANAIKISLSNLKWFSDEVKAEQMLRMVVPSQDYQGFRERMGKKFVEDIEEKLTKHMTELIRKRLDKIRCVNALNAFSDVLTCQMLEYRTFGSIIVQAAASCWMVRGDVCRSKQNEECSKLKRCSVCLDEEDRYTWMVIRAIDAFCFVSQQQ